MLSSSADWEGSLWGWMHERGERYQNRRRGRSSGGETDRLMASTS